MYWGFVFAGYGLIFAALGLYAAFVLHRGRELAKRVPEERRRFLD